MSIISMLTLFYRNGEFTTARIVGESGFLLFTFSIIVAGILYGIGSSTIQYVSKNILASPSTIGLFPAISFAYIISNIYGFQSKEITKFILSLVITLLVIGIYFLIDLKVTGSDKIVYSFIIAMLLSTISIVLYAYYGLQREGALLFSVSKLNFTWTKFYIGLICLGISITAISILSRKIYIYNLNTNFAKTQGINIIKLKIISFFITALATNGAYYAFGIVSFLGLVIPNVLRIIGIEKFQLNLIASSMLITTIMLFGYFISTTLLLELFASILIITIPMLVPIILKIRKVGAHV